MKVGIINYGSGNIKSISNALSSINISSDFISNPNELKKFDNLILPGVGAFKTAINSLKASGFYGEIIEHVERKKKLLGICLGMQLLFEESTEFGFNQGLGIIEGSVLPFSEKINLRIPHVGWNNIFSPNSEYSIFSGDYYFIHSFYCKPKNKENILFETDYEINFCSGIKKENVYGLQFHPEKSQKMGLKLLNKIINE